MKKLETAIATLKTKVNPRALLCTLTSATAVLGTSVMCFASTPEPLPTIAITQDMLSPLVEGVIANVAAILPVGLGIFAVFLGIRIIPSLINRFTHA